MKRTITALAICCSLLLALSLFLFPPVKAKENPLLTLLNLPAPPPPNPLVTGTSGQRDQKFYDKSKPPRDDAPMADLLDYWRHQSGSYQDLRYQPEMSETVRSRILNEVSRDHKLLPGLVNALRGDERSANLIKEIYDGGEIDKEGRATLKEWLKFNTSHFSNDLEQVASGAGDTDGYVTNQEEVLALTSVDFNKARPIIDRLYNDTSLKTSRVLARWALYRHALETDSIGDIERYRDELKAIVEDRDALPGMRDLAMDALVAEKEWSGRDDWYFSLLSDETLAELKVNGTTYTGLTTLMLVSPQEKYVDKMLDLVESENVAVRTAAVKNLLLKLDSGGAAVIKVFLPWLDDPNWVLNSEQSRHTVIIKLSEYQIPESVPGLIKVLDEKQVDRIPRGGLLNANMAANAANIPVYTLTNTLSNRAYSNIAPKDTVEVISYPYRFTAVSALAKQKDARAVPHLRRILPLGETYQRGVVVGAILACGGFTIAEQMDALDLAATGVRKEIDAAEGLPDSPPQMDNFELASNTNAHSNRPITPTEMKVLLAQQLVQQTEITDELARAIVARIAALETNDPGLAQAYRKMILRWQNSVINLLLLSDLKTGKANSDTILRLLSQRKELREKHSSDLADLRAGVPEARGIAPCLLEDRSDADAILDNTDVEAKIALMTCSRLIRLSLPVDKVATNFETQNELLKTAAERYLESEDSIAARNIVLARHPNEARIMGAKSTFTPEGTAISYHELLWALYMSVGNESLYNGWAGSGNDDELTETGKRLQEEVKKDDNLAGVYSYNGNYIRIYKDRVIYSWDEDKSRYRERPMSKYEFDEIRTYLTTNNVDELPPFLSCGGEYCEARELLMLGRSGGRRVYMNGEPGQFFTGLDKYFEGLRQTPGTLKYGLSREIPGLEILLASEGLYAETVWSAPGDLRVAASDAVVRAKLEGKIRDFITGEGDPEPEEDEMPVEGEARPDSESTTETLEALVEKRRTMGKSWYSISGGSVTGVANQPPSVEYIPVADAQAVKPSPQRWKARTSEIELRTSKEGLFKLARGKLIKVGDGPYDSPVISANGRWAAVVKGEEEYDTQLVRIDLATGREYPVEIEGYGRHFAAAYIPVLNKFLVVAASYYGEAGYYNFEESTQPENNPESLLLLDPATGALQPIAGEFRPLSQQTFRPLQQASKPNEFWAAITDAQKNQTQVGVFDTRNFGFRVVLTIPKIKFNSMDMWVDESVGKVYFVYRGHLLALPLPK